MKSSGGKTHGWLKTSVRVDLGTRTAEGIVTGRVVVGRGGEGWAGTFLEGQSGLETPVTPLKIQIPIFSPEPSSACSSLHEFKKYLPIVHSGVVTIVGWLHRGNEALLALTT